MLIITIITKRSGPMFQRNSLKKKYLGEPLVVLEEYSIPSLTVNEVLRIIIFHETFVRGTRRFRSLTFGS